MRIFYTFYGGVFHGVCMCVCVYVLTCIYTHIHTQLYMLCAESFQSCPTLCDPMDHSLPGSSVFGILQATTLEWISMPSSKGSSRPRDPVHILRLLHWQVDFLPLVPPEKPFIFLSQSCFNGHLGCKHPLPTTQELTLHMDITRWSIPKSDLLYSLQLKMEKLYTVSKNKSGS